MNILLAGIAAHFIGNHFFLLLLFLKSINGRSNSTPHYSDLAEKSEPAAPTLP